MIIIQILFVFANKVIILWWTQIKNKVDNYSYQYRNIITTIR